MRKKLSIALFAVLGLSACTNQATPSTTPHSDQASPSGTVTLHMVDGIVDPLSEITNPKDDRYVAPKVGVVLHRRGTGPQKYSIALSSASSVRAYVACSPASAFEVQVGKKFKGGCASTFQNFADIPSGGAKVAIISVPQKTRFVLLVIPTPDN